MVEVASLEEKVNQRIEGVPYEKGLVTGWRRGSDDTTGDEDSDGQNGDSGCQGDESDFVE